MIAEFMISGDWVIAFFIAVIPVIGGVWLKAKSIGKNEARREKVTLESPMPEMPVRKVSTPPTFSQHQELVRRVGVIETEATRSREYFETQIREIRREQAEQFVKLMQAGEVRKDMIFEKIDSMARGFHHRVDQVLDAKQNPHKS